MVTGAACALSRTGRDREPRMTNPKGPSMTKKSKCPSCGSRESEPYCGPTPPTTLRKCIKCNRVYQEPKP